MQRQYFGSKREELKTFLSKNWQQDGPCACVFQGCPGTGKTELAGEIERVFAEKGYLVISVECRAQGIKAVSEFFLELASAFKQRGREQLSNVRNTGPDDCYPYALISELQDRTLVVVDEAQDLLDNNPDNSPSQIQDLFRRLAHAHHAKGRLLVITNRRVDKSASWITSHLVVENPELSEPEAEQMLHSLLETEGLQDAIPAALQKTIVKRLACNPRAIGTLVGCLTVAPLCELLQEPSELGDVIIGHELAEKLEREILIKAMPKIDQPTQLVLGRLSVFRRSFDIELFKKLRPKRTEARQLVNDLIRRYLMNHANGRLALHPIARELWSSALREDVTKWREAHLLATDSPARA